ncbi:uncharacterized protein STEHIDRAFT_59803, partial [Stereum hirsutum FP-91666 SS1]|uniref:uncharacterized protein n=1 Tax=Stereum hirsutum (strain FP-91666) TaxID=721885 RepID=UPI000444A201
MQPQIRQDIEPSDPDRDVNITDVINEWSLNQEQARAFQIIAEHSLQNKPAPLRMYLGGPGGTGKSRVIQSL